MCEKWHIPPASGGLLDQDAETINSMTTLENVYNAVDRWNNLQGTLIHNLTDRERRLLRWLKDDGLWMTNG